MFRPRGFYEAAAFAMPLPEGFAEAARASVAASEAPSDNVQPQTIADAFGIIMRLVMDTAAPAAPEELAELAGFIGEIDAMRASIEQRIEELKSDLAADDFCLNEFFATEAAFLGILMLFNLLGEFQRATGMSGYRQPSTLRAQVFLCGAILGGAARRTVLHLSAAWGGLDQRNSLFDKLLQYEIPTSPKLGFQPLPGG